MCAFLVFASPEPVQSGSHLFFPGGSCRVSECDPPCARRVALFPGPDYIPRGRLVNGLATCLAPGLLFAFLSLPHLSQCQAGRTFFCEIVAECDLPCARWVALLPLEARLHTPSTQAGWNLETKALNGVTCDLRCARWVAHDIWYAFVGATWYDRFFPVGLIFAPAGLLFTGERLTPLHR